MHEYIIVFIGDSDKEYIAEYSHLYADLNWLNPNQSSPPNLSQQLG